MKHIDEIAALLTEDPDVINEIVYQVGQTDQKHAKLGDVERAVLTPGQQKVKITDPRTEHQPDAAAVTTKLQQILSVDRANPGAIFQQLAQKDPRMAMQFRRFIERIPDKTMMNAVSDITSVKQGVRKIMQSFDQWRKQSRK